MGAASDVSQHTPVCAPPHINYLYMGKCFFDTNCLRMTLFMRHRRMFRIQMAP